MTVFSQGIRKCCELLPQGHGHCILKLGPADFEDAGEGLAFNPEGAGKKVVFGAKPFNAAVESKFDGSGVGIIRALGAVDVVQRDEPWCSPPSAAPNASTHCLPELR